MYCAYVVICWVVPASMHLKVGLWLGYYHSLSDWGCCTLWLHVRTISLCSFKMVFIHSVILRSRSISLCFYEIEFIHNCNTQSLGSSSIMYLVLEADLQFSLSEILCFSYGRCHDINRGLAYTMLYVLNWICLYLLYLYAISTNCVFIRGGRFVVLPSLFIVCVE